MNDVKAILFLIPILLVGLLVYVNFEYGKEEMLNVADCIFGGPCRR